MTRENNPEKDLQALRNLLKSLEDKCALQAARWEETLAKAPAWKKLQLADTIDRQTARNEHELSVLRWRISELENQITRQAEETRQREAARAWLIPIKAQARESWLNSGGMESAFEASWPEMERKILMQETLESLAVQPGTKQNWNSKWDRKLKPPSDPKKKKS